MRVKTIRVSNILSFCSEEVPECREVVLNRGLNILIGPNASGKSNFLEILHFAINRLVQNQFVYNEGKRKKDNQKHQTIQRETNYSDGLIKNHKHPEDAQLIELTVKISEGDKKNLINLFDNQDEFKSFLKKYTSTGFQINPDHVSLEALLKVEELNFLFRRNKPNTSFEDCINESPEQQHWKEFFQNIELCKLIRELIAENGVEIPAFLPSVAGLGCYRGYQDLPRSYKLGQMPAHAFSNMRSEVVGQNFLSGKSKQGTAFRGFQVRVTNRAFEIRRKHGDEAIASLLPQVSFIKRINDNFRSLLGMHLVFKVSPHPGLEVEFRFVDESGVEQAVSDFSSGQKELLSLLMLAYGFEVEDGLLLIDEPELHLHPQLQTAYLDQLSKLSKEGIQIITVTHSPVFVNRYSIESVFRFSKKVYTDIQHPGNIKVKEKDLIRFLDYSKTSKVFFFDKVILVEGYGDQFFYSKFLKYLNKNFRGFEPLPAHVFLVIHSKNEAPKWREFLEKFNIDVRYIGDLDNVTDDIFPDDFMENYRNDRRGKIVKRLDKKVLRSKKSKDRKDLIKKMIKFCDQSSEVNKKEFCEILSYVLNRITPTNKLMSYAKDNRPELYDQVIEKINQSSQNKEYILKCGELEDYLGISKQAGLGGVLSFCGDDQFLSWWQDNKFQKHRKELIKKMGNILYN